MRKGLLLGAIQLLLLLSVTGKFLYDRQALPRAWARTTPVDPFLPLRGRYVRLGVEVEMKDQAPMLVAADGRQLALHGVKTVPAGPGKARLAQPIAFFIPENVPDPSVRKPGEELWVEVSVPKKGPPRPVHLGVKKDGVLTLLVFN
ncbi:MAG: hypothetical protein HY235_15960 [Acidobacteria bacterium]|nr:hypothetical protein [Acidobacteriota bacterium]